DFRDGDFIVAEGAHVLAQFTEILHDVVGEGVVVVDHQQHFQNSPSRPSCTCPAAPSTARALFSVSCHSISGIESATMPAAACTYSMPSLITPVRIAIATCISPPKER